MEIAQLHSLFLKHPIISTDTRKIEKGSLYFALSGAHFNGNDFALEALEKGAAYAIVDQELKIADSRIILVTNVLKSLQSLATYHRNYCKATVIGLTGSNGKTTTKELIQRVLSKKYKTIATKGNLNNHIGVPLSLLTIKEETDFAIIEMGANHQGEIALLSEIAQPDFGCITNFGKAHLEGFGGVEGVIKGKTELYNYLLSHSKTVLYNEQDPIQKEKLAGYHNTVSFGTTSAATYMVRYNQNSHSENTSFTFQGTVINPLLYGNYNIPNCMIAASIGAYFGISLGAINNAISAYEPDNNRSEVKKIGKHEVIMDAYNANPSSMEAALKHFGTLKTSLENKIVILGDMFELGDTAAQEHQAIINLLQSLALDKVILIGNLFAVTTHPFSAYKDFADLKEDFSHWPASLILIKGSRGMALERLIPFLED